MTRHISKVTWTVLALMLVSLSACGGKHEEQGKQLGKKMDNFEGKVAKKLDEEKEAARNAKDNAVKKTHELHEKAKEKAHEAIDKS